MNDVGFRMMMGVFVVRARGNARKVDCEELKKLF